MKAFHIPRDQYRFIIIIEMLKYTLTPAPLFCRVRVRAVLVPVAKSRRKKKLQEWIHQRPGATSNGDESSLCLKGV